MSKNAPAVGVIGMGRVGPAIASALRAGGHPIAGVAARSDGAKERADLMLPGVEVMSDLEVAKKSDILFLAVADSEIEALTERLVKEGGIRPGQIIAHLSGSQGVGALGSAAGVGALPLALHPAMTFTGTSLDVKALEGLPIAYTCAPVAEPLAISLIYSIGGTPFAVAEEDRGLYHAALAHGSNHLLTVITQATRALAEAGVDEPQEFMTPLVKAAAERALTEGIDGLTGPLQRKDTSTVKNHLLALGKNPSLKGVRETYEQLARATLRELGRGTQESSAPILLRTRSELTEQLDAARLQGMTRLGLVMTMGALHEGHLSLVERLKEDHDQVLVTIFVNPEQFGQGEDFDQYPRDLDRDLELLAKAGATWVYAPGVDQVYPVPPRVRIQPGPAGHVLEGALRPGHFAGVLQVVGKVFDLVRPQTAIFGQKDAQQFVNIRQMVQDLDQQIELIEAPIVRDEHGLALSSRNAYLDARELILARTLNKALNLGSELTERNVPAPDVVVATAAVFTAVPQINLEYVALAGQDDFDIWALWAPSKEAAATLSGTETSLVAQDLSLGTAWVPDAYLNGETEEEDGAAYLLVAARVGQTRLIDNVKVKVRR